MNLSIYALALVTLLSAPGAFGQSPPPAITPWLKDLAANDNQQLQQYQVFVASGFKDGEPTFFEDLKPHDIRTSIFRFRGQPDWRLFKSLNSHTRLRRGKGLVQQLLTGLESSAFLVCKDSICRLTRMLNGKLKVIAKNRARQHENQQAFLDWWRQLVGYDGVVLASRNDYILAALVNGKPLGSDTQALAYANSANRFILSKGKTKGRALLAVTKQEGPFVILTNLFGKPVANGTKLLISQHIEANPPAAQTPPTKQTTTPDQP